jgi:hypothetical protein
LDTANLNTENIENEHASNEREVTPSSRSENEWVALDRLPKSPWFRPATTHTQEYDLVLLMVAGQKRYLITLRNGQQLHTHLCIFSHD